MGLLNRMGALGGGMLGAGGQMPPYMPQGAPMGGDPGPQINPGIPKPPGPEQPQINPGPGMQPPMPPQMPMGGMGGAFQNSPQFQQQLMAMMQRQGGQQPAFQPPQTPAQITPQQSTFRPRGSVGALGYIAPNNMAEWLRQNYPNVGG